MNRQKKINKSLLKRITPFLVVLCMMCGFMLPMASVTVYAATASEHTQSSTRISNDYLVATANTEGSLALYTTGGDPNKSTDNNARLLYGSLESGTSKTIIRVGDSTIRFQGTPYSTPGADSLYMTDSIYGIFVECYISFVYNTYTGRYDTVEYKYVLTNTSSTAKDVGARIFFDTMLGDNDHAPFMINGEKVTTHREYVGENVPQVWHVFDSYTASKVVASGTLYNDVSERPDKVQFLNWSNGNHDGWNCSGSGNIGDSAVNVYFNPTTLQPNESKTVKTYYGISQFMNPDLDSDPVIPDGAALNITAMAPASLLINNDHTAYLGNPFSFNGGIYNIGNEVAENVVAVITLPEGLSVNNDTIRLGDIPVGGSATAFWSITADNRYEDATLQYSVTYYADGIEPKTTNYTITIPSLSDTPITHLFEETSRLDATCTTNGRIVNTCSICGETQSTTIPALGHDYANGVCSHCGGLEACEHEWVETTHTNSTCTTNGLIVSTCSLCDGKQNRETPALGHDYVNGVCSRCGRLEVCVHEWYETTHTDATCTTDGLIVNTCSLCGETQSTTIPALGHDYVNDTCSRCGDVLNNNMILIIAIIFICIILVLI